MSNSGQGELVCAIDLGGTNLRAAIIDSEGRIHKRLKFKTPQTSDASGIVSAIAAAVRASEQDAAKSIQAVSVVVPGSVEQGSAVVVNAPNIPSLVGVKLGDALEKELNAPVLLENDANAAAIGEMWQGAGRGHRTIVCLTLGTGVGSGIILDGELWRGADGTAGEIGHTSVDPFGGVECKCGNTGCLEVYGSATAIVRMTREGLVNHSASSLHSIADGDLTAEKISHAATSGDEFALSVFRKMGTYLGIAMANLVNTLNPEVIVIGGGVSAGFDLFAEYARAEVMRRAFPVPAERCRIVKGECGDDAGLLGAAWLTFGVR
ncbi:MAG TPA: ROK family protein [Pyrinomonadaceae bacterium]|nr:ROK family protein [Pyrinomonadaceae bacterium]